MAHIYSRRMIGSLEVASARAIRAFVTGHPISIPEGEKINTLQAEYIANLNLSNMSML